MNDNDKKEFAELIIGNGEMYNKVISKTLMSLYFEALKIYSIADIRTGFSKHSMDPKNGSFFPKPADIARHLQTSEISAEDKALLAWAQVMREIRATGSYGTLKLDDKQALAAIKALGSWKQLCGSTVDEMTWKKKEFLAIYETYENTPIDMLPSSMPGLIELQQHKAQVSDAMTRLKAGVNSHRAKLSSK